MKRYQNVLRFLSLGLVVLFSLNMGQGGYRVSKTKELPEIFGLKRGRPNYSGVISIDKVDVLVKRIRFYDAAHMAPRTRNYREGETCLMARNESDKSYTKVDLGTIKELEVIEESFASGRFKGLIYCKIRVTTNEGKKIDNLLITHDAEICAHSQEEKMDKSWFVRKVKKITDIGIKKQKEFK